jgi:hypothetical protein
MQKLLTALLLATCTIQVSAQTSLMTKGSVNTDNRFYSVSTKQTSDGGHIHAGRYEGQGWNITQIFLMKTNSVGATEWTKLFNIPDAGHGDVDENVGEVIITSDGGYAIVGDIMNWPAVAYEKDVYIIKTYSDGSLDWYQKYGAQSSHEMAYTIIELTDEPGKFVLAGSLQHNRIISVHIEPYWYEDGKHVMVMKVDGTSSPKGQVVWSHLYTAFSGGNDTKSEAYKIIQVEDGFALCGYQGYVIGSNWQSWGILYKLNSTGSLTFGKRFYPGGNMPLWESCLNSLISLGSGGYALTGNVLIDKTGAGKVLQPIVMRTNTSGNISWINYHKLSYSGTTREEGSGDDIILDDGKLHIAGYRTSRPQPLTPGPQVGRYYYLSTDLSGNKLASYEYGDFGNWYDQGNYMRKTSSIAPRNGGLCMTGMHNIVGAANEVRMTLLHTNAVGKLDVASCQASNEDPLEATDNEDEEISITVTDNVIDRSEGMQLENENYSPVEEINCRPIAIGKFFDANINGKFDGGEEMIAGWNIVVNTGDDITGHVTGSNGQIYVELGNGFTVKELNLPWFIPITPDNYIVPVSDYQEEYLFGNYKCPNECVVVNDMVMFQHMEETTLSVGSTICNVLDASGSMVTGGFGAGALSTSGPAGNNNAIRFQRGSHIAVPDYPGLNFGMGNFSGDAYIYIANGAGRQVIMSKIELVGGTTRKGWEWYYQGGTLHFASWNGLGGGVVWNPASAFVPTGGWHHVAFLHTVNGAHTRFFIDSVQTSTSMYSNYPWNINNSAPLLIGQNMDGSIDEPSLYSRWLTATDITDIINKTKCREYIQIENTNNGCQSGFTDATYIATVYNGDLNTNNFKFALAGLPAGGICNVNGPDVFNPATGNFTLSGCGDNKTFGFSIPCASTFNSGNQGCFALTVLNETAGRCAMEDATGISLNSMLAPERTADQHQIPEYPANAVVYDDGIIQTATINHGSDGNPVSGVSVYPNPFDLETTVSFLLNSGSDVQVFVLDMAGREVRSYNKGFLAPGNHSIVLDELNLENGIYMVKIRAGKMEYMQKIIRQH